MGSGNTNQQSSFSEFMQRGGTPMSALAFVLVIASFATDGAPGPADWLVEWTNWAFAFFGITIGGRALFWSGTRLRDQWLQSNNQGQSKGPE